TRRGNGRRERDQAWERMEKVRKIIPGAFSIFERGTDGEPAPQDVLRDGVESLTGRARCPSGPGPVNLRDQDCSWRGRPVGLGRAHRVEFSRARDTAPGEDDFHGHRETGLRGRPDVRGRRSVQEAQIGRLPSVPSTPCEGETRNNLGRVTRDGCHALPRVPPKAMPPRSTSSSSHWIGPGPCTAWWDRCSWTKTPSTTSRKRCSSRSWDRSVSTAASAKSPAGSTRSSSAASPTIFASSGTPPRSTR